MSTRHKNGSKNEEHQRAAQLDDQPAHAHRSAAEGDGKQDHPGDSIGHEETATLAHTLWQKRGCPQGSPNEDWSHASELLRSQLSKDVAARQNVKVKNATGGN